MSLFMGLILASCNDDDDYFVNENPILNSDSVVTGSADATATTLTFHGTVTGLENTASSFYTVGFNYGFAEDALTQSVAGTLTDGVLTAEITGLEENTLVYYQAFVTLKKKVTITGAVKSMLTTDTKVVTKAADAVNAYGATVGGTVTGSPADAAYGIVIAASENEEAVRAGLIIPAADGATADFAIEYAGLAPATNYYYAAYANLGSCIVYGEVQPLTTAAFDFDVDEDLVDLGLSVKWAKFNLGAPTESAYGGRFGYGDLTGVNNSIKTADYASTTIYQTPSDMANHAWGGKVTLPGAADFEELFNRCTKEWTQVDGVNGYRFTGPNGNSIFLPAAGSRTANDLNGVDVFGAYATGSINPTDSQYDIAFRFDSSNSGRTSFPVYVALSVRPVSVARNVPFDESLLYNTWEIDYYEGKSIFFQGPVYFYGTDDSWRTVTNHEPIVGNSWSWEADCSPANEWAFGGAAGTKGYMTLTEDHKVTVEYPDGTKKEGTYTVDKDNYTISADIDFLAPSTLATPDFPNRKTNIKVLSLTADMFQLGYYRDNSDPATVSCNMIPKSKKYGYPVNLICVDKDFGGTWGTEVGNFEVSNINGVHTLKYEGSCPGVKVLTLDVAGLNAAFPNAIVAVKEIRLDGASIKFDANKFYYGDIEDNGNFRVQMFNIWGKGSNNENVDSPFSNTVGNVEPAFSFNSSMEIDYVILTDPVFEPKWITINPNWGGDWNYTQGAKFNIVVDENSKLTFDNPAFDITLTGDIYAAGSIMTFAQVDELHNYFPGVHSTLDALYLDGKEVTGWDPAKVLDAVDGTAYRLELWNMYGATKDLGCAFGTPVQEGDNLVIKELGFQTSMQAKFTFRRLFPEVNF